ncbi:MAG TPA: hypothetical protein VGN00_20605 [Puia sp.]|jgi:hypothetical protein
MNETEYSCITYDTPLYFAQRLAGLLLKLPFKKVYNFRPGFMKPTPGQKNIKSYYKVISSLSPLLRVLFPGQVSSMRAVGLAMINSVLIGYPKRIVEVKDIKILAKA